MQPTRCQNSIFNRVSRGTTEKQNRDKSVPAQRRLPGTRPYRGAQTAIMTMIAMFDICYAIRGVVITLIDYH